MAKLFGAKRLKNSFALNRFAYVGFGVHFIKGLSIMKRLTHLILIVTATAAVAGFATRTEGNSRSDVLVSTEYVALHKNGPNVVTIEVDANIATYREGHIPGALGWDWQTQLNDNLRRDIISKFDFETLLSKSGIGNNTTVILYGDNPAFPL
jgi:hypothetical protein